MAKNNVVVKEVKNVIREACENYSDEAIDATKTAITEVTKHALRIAKQKAPVRTGKYKRHLIQRTYIETLTERKNIIGVKSPHYRIAHLIEHGHVKKSGGKTKATPHFAYAEDYIIQTLPYKIKENIENIEK